MISKSERTNTSSNVIIISIVNIIYVLYVTCVPCILCYTYPLCRGYVMCVRPVRRAYAITFYASATRKCERDNCAGGVSTSV